MHKQILLNQKNQDHLIKPAVLTCHVDAQLLVANLDLNIGILVFIDIVKELFNIDTCSGQLKLHHVRVIKVWKVAVFSGNK